MEAVNWQVSDKLANVSKTYCTYTIIITNNLNNRLRLLFIIFIIIKNEGISVTLKR